MSSSTLTRSRDDDFVYMANAKYFLPTGGGYGGQASFCVEKLGGTVIRIPGGAGYVTGFDSGR